MPGHKGRWEKETGFLGLETFHRHQDHQDAQPLPAVAIPSASTTPAAMRVPHTVPGQAPGQRPGWSMWASVPVSLRPQKEITLAF